MLSYNYLMIEPKKLSDVIQKFFYVINRSEVEDLHWFSYKYYVDKYVVTEDKGNNSNLLYDVISG